jgi:hypothetical protein
MQNLLGFETGPHSRDHGQPVTVSGNVSIPFSRARLGNAQRRKTSEYFFDRHVARSAQPFLSHRDEPQRTVRPHRWLTTVSPETRTHRMFTD